MYIKGHNEKRHVGYWGLFECDECKKKFKRTILENKRRKHTFCDRTCYNKYMQISYKKTDEMIKLREQGMSLVKIGNEFGIVHNSVIQRFKSRGYIYTKKIVNV